METRATTRGGLRIDAGDVIVEIISIVIALSLAYALNAWHDGAKQRRDASAALDLIRREVVANREALVPRLRHHENITAAFASLESKTIARHRVSYDIFWQTFRRVNPNGFMPFAAERTAWDLAHTSGALANVDQAVLVPLEEVYHRQDQVESYRDKIIADLHVVPVEGDNVFYSLSGFLIDTGDLMSNERNLLAHYDDALRALDGAGIR